MNASVSDRSTDSVYRDGGATRSTGPTYERDGRTNEESFSPTRDNSPSVTRTPTYGDFLKLDPNRYARPRTARTPKVVAAIHELVEDGLSDRAIAKRLGIHARTVGVERNAAGIPPATVDTYVDDMAVARAVSGDRPEHLTPFETRAAVQQLTNQGKSLRQIAAILRVTPRTVTRHRAHLNKENAA